MVRGLLGTREAGSQAVQVALCHHEPLALQLLHTYEMLMGTSGVTKYTPFLVCIFFVLPLVGVTSCAFPRACGVDCGWGRVG